MEFANQTPSGPITITLSTPSTAAFFEMTRTRDSQRVVFEQKNRNPFHDRKQAYPRNPNSKYAQCYSTTTTVQASRSRTSHRPQAASHEIHFPACEGDSLVESRAVIIHRNLDQGSGSRCVYLAQDARAPRKMSQLYALKRVDCQDNQDEVKTCQGEIYVHRTLMQLKNENLMPLLGAKFESSLSPLGTYNNLCYMLFPYVCHSLRDEINCRHLLDDMLESRRRPYSEKAVLTLFEGIVHGVEAMHSAGWSHRDLKPSNILLQRKQGKHRKGHVGFIPVISDFGSAGPLAVPTESWSDIIHAAEDAKQNTTFAYRAPELFGIGLSYGPAESLHYVFSDIWSLGCLLFAMMYGASPFEIEWRVSLVEGAAADGTARIVECTRDKVCKAMIPFPPLGGAADRRYSEVAKDLVRKMLQKDGRARPSCALLSVKIGHLLRPNGR